MPVPPHCIELVAKAGGFDREEAERILKLAKKHHDMELARGLADSTENILRGYAKRRADERLRQGARAYNRAARDILARDRIGKKVGRMVSEGMDEAQALEADLIGTHRGFAEGRTSVAVLQKTLEGKYVGPVKRAFKEREHILKLIARPHVTAHRRSEAKRFLDDVAREMWELRPDGNPGRTANEDARFLAGILSKQSNDIRLAMNAHGADIGELAGWAPQRHDEPAILTAGKTKWIGFVRDKLDLDKTFPNLAYAPDAEAYIGIKLGETFDHIVTGKPLPDVDITIPQELRNVASRYEQHRYLHFRDADSWLEYQREFGRGDVVQATLDHITSQARALSLMMRYGTRPRQVLRGVIRHLEREIDDNELIPVEEKRTRKNRLRRKALDHAMAEVMGDTLRPDNLTLAKVGHTVRAHSSVTRLGSTFLSAFPDVAIAMNRLRYQGKGLVETLHAVWQMAFHGKSKEEMRKTSYLMDAFVDGTLGQLYSRWNVEDGLPGMITTGMTQFHRMTFLTQWTDGWTAGWVRVTSADMADMAARAWDELPEKYVHVLKQHGFDHRKWHLISRLVREAADGKRYVIPEAVRELPDETIDSLIQGRPGNLAKRRAEIREELELDVLGYFGDEAQYAVISGDARTRRFLIRGTQPGEPMGELARLMAQFKSFPIAFLQRVMTPAIYGRPGHAGRSMFRNLKDPKVLGDIAFVIAATTILGNVSWNAREVSKGRMPRIPKDPQDALDILMASFVQGGGAGIYGDFLFGRFSRFGRSPVETLAGPALSGPFSDLWYLWAEAREGNLEAGNVLYTAINNTPYINLWYTRTALDYLILYHLQEMMSPGVLERRERRMKKESGIEYIVPPSTVIKRGGGFQ